MRPTSGDNRRRNTPDGALRAGRAWCCSNRSYRRA